MNSIGKYHNGEKIVVACRFQYNLKVWDKINNKWWRCETEIEAEQFIDDMLKEIERQDTWTTKRYNSNIGA